MRRYGWLVVMCVGCATDGVGEFHVTTGLPTVAGSSAPVTVQVRNTHREALTGVAVRFQVARGGGKVSEVQATDTQGEAHAVWTLGKAPVPQQLWVRLGSLAESLDVLATLPQPWTTETWGDVETALKDVQGSTEDLAFAPDGTLVMGKPGGLLQVDAQGHATPKALTGDAIEGPLGLAYDAQGNLWVADNKGKSLRKVAPNGQVTTMAGLDLQMPNDVAVDAKGRVWVTDTCGGKLQRFDPAQGKVDAVVPFDGAKDGGPNGVTVDAIGDVWMTTENTVLFCKVPGEVEDPVASLYRVPMTGDQPGKPVAVLSHHAFAGDGLTFDHEGNLYVIFDHEKDFALTESTVWILPKGQTTPLRFLTATDRTFANLVFGKGSYGETTLYLSLVAVQPFTSARGLQRFVVGITGP